MRTCLVCRRVRAKRELTRLALQDGAIVADLDRRASGRGAYVCRERSCRERARAKAAGALRAPRAVWRAGATL
ncbi:MAG TPA: DUF448 domain-containing protein [Actinomycetota bacterium]